jgi:hypothetical protein
MILVVGTSPRVSLAEYLRAHVCLVEILQVVGCPGMTRVGGVHGLSTID